jgi:hypothetical protein
MEPYIAKNWGWSAKVEDKLVWLLVFQNWCRHSEGTSTCCHFSSMLPQHSGCQTTATSTSTWLISTLSKSLWFLAPCRRVSQSFLPKQVRLAHQPVQQCILSETWTKSLLSLSASKEKSTKHLYEQMHPVYDLHMHLWEMYLEVHNRQWILIRLHVTCPMQYTCHQAIYTTPHQIKHLQFHSEQLV